MKRALLLCALLLSCGANEPRVVVSVTGDGGDDLVRVRVLVRECGKNQFALLRDIDVTETPPKEPFDAAIVPGKIFYVWVQAWEECQVEGECPDEENATPGTCVCVDGAASSGEKITSEACSRWLKATDGVTEVPLRLGPVRGACPPMQLDSCDALE